MICRKKKLATRKMGGANTNNRIFARQKYN